MFTLYHSFFVWHYFVFGNAPLSLLLEDIWIIWRSICGGMQKVITELLILDQHKENVIQVHSDLEHEFLWRIEASRESEMGNMPTWSI